MIDNDKMIPVADLVHSCGGNLAHNDSFITVHLPPTKTQHRKGQDGDIIMVRILDEIAAINEVTTRVKEWREFWQLKESITQKDIKDYLKKKLNENDKWALMGLLKIYSFQTPSEQAVDHTILRNDVGFSGIHAEIMSSIAKQLEERIADRRRRRVDPDPTKCLSTKQKALVRKVIQKYWRQILDASDEMKLLRMVKKHKDEESRQIELNLD